MCVALEKIDDPINFNYIFLATHVSRCVAGTMSRNSHCNIDVQHTSTSDMSCNHICMLHIATYVATACATHFL